MHAQIPYNGFPEKSSETKMSSAKALGVKVLKKAFELVTDAGSNPSRAHIGFLRVQDVAQLPLVSVELPERTTHQVPAEAADPLPRVYVVESLSLGDNYDRILWQRAFNDTPRPDDLEVN
jgi:hypothetical protein